MLYADKTVFHQIVEPNIDVEGRIFWGQRSSTHHITLRTRMLYVQEYVDTPVVKP
jgi:hypothetical protein